MFMPPDYQIQKVWKLAGVHGISGLSPTSSISLISCTKVKIDCCGPTQTMEALTLKSILVNHENVDILLRIGHWLELDHAFFQTKTESSIFSISNSIESYLGFSLGEDDWLGHEILNVIRSKWIWDLTSCGYFPK